MLNVNINYKTMNKIRKKILGLPALITLLTLGNVNAQNLLVNGDFEDYTLAVKSETVSGVPGWGTVNAITGAVTANSYTAAWVAGTLKFTGGWMDSQESLPGVLAALGGANYGTRNSTYAVSPLTFQDVVTVAGTSYNLSGLLANAEKAGALNSAPAGAIASVLVDGVAVVNQYEGQWTNFSYTFTAASNSTRISFGITQSDLGTNWMGVDDLSLIAVVPEPSSTLLLGLGSLGLFVRRNRI